MRAVVHITQDQCPDWLARLLRLPGLTEDEKGRIYGDLLLQREGRNPEKFFYEELSDIAVVAALKHVFLQAHAPGEERSPKKLKTSRSIFLELVDEAVGKWKSRYSQFLGKSKEKGFELDRKNGVPLDHRGVPSILLDRLTEGWTRDVKSLWDRAEDGASDVVPVVGVSGSGKTRFLYELLAAKWGFFWTARTKGNGGSEDIRVVTSDRTGDDKKANHMKVMTSMRCAILARLLILENFLNEIPDFKPLQWLMLQVQFRAFGAEDVYLALTTDLKDLGVKDEEGLNRMIRDLWKNLETRLGCKFISVLDEAQGLKFHGVDCYQSPETGYVRPIFSPLIKAILVPSKEWEARKVLIVGTGLSFLKLEDEIGSGIAKPLGTEGLQLFSAPFSSWKDVDDVLKFCKRYLKLEDGQEADNAGYLLRKFKGRRRCLVSCVEQLLEQKDGVWSEEVVDEYFKKITTGGNNNDSSSIYYAVQHLCDSSGNFHFKGKHCHASGLVQRLGLFLAFMAEGEFLVTSKEDMTLLECGLGQLQKSSDSSNIFLINEPTVHWSILNYLESTITLQVLLKNHMVNCMPNPSAVGRLWEVLFTMHVAKLFDGKNLLADMCCFKGADLGTLPGNFAIDKPVITGELTGVWRESYKKKTVTAFLDADEKSRQSFLIFDDRSGPDVLFVVKLGDLKIPVFCQLKL